MNKFLLCVATICGLICLALFIFEAPKEDINSQLIKQATPEKIVEMFIDSAIKGDEEAVKNIVSTSPISYSTICIRTKYPADSSEDVDYNIDDELVVLPDYKVTKPTDYSKEKFVNLSNPNSDLSLAFIAAQHIYTTNNIFKKINISSAEIYNNEAVVVVEYVISDSSKSTNRFLLIKDGHWKLFTTESLDIKTSVLNKNYAKPRPLCEQD